MSRAIVLLLQIIFFSAILSCSRSYHLELVGAHIAIPSAVLAAKKMNSIEMGVPETKYDSPTISLRSLLPEINIQVGQADAISHSNKQEESSSPLQQKFGTKKVKSIGQTDDETKKVKGKWNALAIISISLLALAFLSLFFTPWIIVYLYLASVVTGGIALGHIKNHPEEKGRGLAWVPIIFAGLVGIASIAWYTYFFISLL